MNKIIELQRKSGELTSDLEDILHAASLNLQALLTEVSHPSINCLQEEFTYLSGLLVMVQKFVSDRAPIFLNYLITKQIQEEEARVRRQRLSEYEEKIYDQKRIITDKEAFFENLLRPKRKRPSHQTPEEFQEVRLRQRQQQEKLKAQQLTRDIADLQILRRILEHVHLRKKNDLEQTKSSSISQVNVSQVGQETVNTEKVIPLEDRTNKSHRRPTHVRSCSVQNQLTGSSLMREQSEEDSANVKIMLSQISKLAKENQELHKIYDQSLLSVNFKKKQKEKAQALYRTKLQALQTMNKEVKLQAKQSDWRKNRVFQPEVGPTKRSGSK